MAEPYIAGDGSTPIGRDVELGQAVYSRRMLAIYDLLVLKISNRWIWRCPSPRILDLYNCHVTGNHLDVGVGTGYFLDRCRFPTPSPRVALLDLNPNCLEATARRIARYRPTCHRGNVLEPIPWNSDRFDSIGVNYLLHCLPGDTDTKGAVFDHLKPLLNPGGVLFGSTLLSDGVPRSALARRLMATYNRRGIFTNTADSLDGLQHALRSRFRHSDIRSIGCAALFWARDKDHSQG